MMIATCGVMWVGSYTEPYASEPKSGAPNATQSQQQAPKSGAGDAQRGLAHAFLIGLAVGCLWLCKRWYSGRNEATALTQDELRESLERLKKQGEQAP